MKKTNIFIISGPSGVGEDSVIEGLKKYLPIERVVTTTTRKMRGRESQKNPYYFINKKKFQNKIKSNQMAEWAKEYNDNFYGVSVEELDRVSQSGKIGIWKIEYKGVITVKKKYPEVKSIFIAPPKLEILEQRIRRRDSEVSEKYIKERMEYTKEWMKHKDIYDYRVINEEGKLEETVQKVAAIIKKNIN